MRTANVGTANKDVHDGRGARVAIKANRLSANQQILSAFPVEQPQEVFEVVRKQRPHS
jgi:hypothetical protein